MNIEQEKMIVEALPSLYPLQEFEEKAIQTILDALPPAQPKRGYWIKTGDKEEAYGTVSKCSVCGVIDYEGNFCPNCGAKMEVQG